MNDSPQSHSRWKRWLVGLVALLTLLYAGACFYFWATQDQKIFAPLKKIATDPDRMGLLYTAAQVPVSTSGQPDLLDGYWVPAEADNEDTAPVVLYLHGQDANIGKNLEHTYRLHQLGCHVLVIDYRGYGKSFGDFSPSESSVYEDAEAAWQYLTVKRGFAPERIVILGHSLGGAVAIELATRHDHAGGLIVEGAFTSVQDMGRQRFPITRLLPIRQLLNHRFESLSKMRDVSIPVLVIHGTDDPKIPWQMGKQLFDAARAPKQWLLVDGGGHANCGSIGLVEYNQAVTKFLEQLPQ